MPLRQCWVCMHGFQDGDTIHVGHVLVEQDNQSLSMRPQIV
jgi:hypothetical protein